MIWCNSEESARLNAIACLADNENIKSVTIGYNKNEKMWYVEQETFTDNEYESIPA